MSKINIVETEQVVPLQIVPRFEEERRFYGQQSDEIILYEIEPHWTRKLIGFLSAIFLSLAMLLIVLFLYDKTRIDPQYLLTGGIITCLIFLFSMIGWVWFSANRARTFITDRRMMRLEVGFPLFWNRRSLFWNEVLKAKGYSPNVLFRALKIGTLGIYPLAAENEDVRIRYVHYFEDLANYVDKILYIYKTKPEEVKDIKPFVAKPTGKRY